MTIIVNDKKLAQQLVRSIRKDFSELHKLLTNVDSDEADLILNEIEDTRSNVNNIALRIHKTL